MRDVLIKSKSLGYRKTAVISEMKGNPRRIEFFDPEGDVILGMDISVSNPLGKGRIRKKNLKLRWELDKPNIKEDVISLLEVPEDPVDLIKSGSVASQLKQHLTSNLIRVKGDQTRAVVEFHDQEGNITGSRIYIHKCRFGG